MAITWAQSRLNTGTDATTQNGRVNHSLNLAGVTADHFDAVYYERIHLTLAIPTRTIDLRSLPNLVCGTDVLDHVIGIYLEDKRGLGVGDNMVEYRPGDTNPYNDIPDHWLVEGRSFAQCDDIIGPWPAVSPTERNIKLTLLAGVEAYVDVVVMGSTIVSPDTGTGGTE
jgi:hypothetical protein